MSFPNMSEIKSVCPVNIKQSDLPTTPLVELFYRVINLLKRPRLKIITPAGYKILVLRRGASAASPHSLSLYMVEEWDLRGEFLGSVHPHSQFIPYEKDFAKDWQDSDGVCKLLDFINELVAKPLETMAASGRLHGFCCFCGAPLRDARSTFHGYGPVCAKHYRIPWDAERQLMGIHVEKVVGVDNVRQ